MAITQAAVVRVSPEAATLEAGKQQQFASVVTGVEDTRVIWSVEEGEAGGTITPEGLYTAPDAAGTYHVLATSLVTPESTARAVVTVVPRGSSIVVTIAPKTATVVGGQTQQFVASVAGTPNTQVIWSVREASGGSVSAAGVYTAPAVAGTYHVVAASAENPAATDSATVTVSAAPVVAITVNPASTQLSAGQGLQLTATVTGTTNTAVTWVVQEGASGGTVTSGGYYFAPATPGQFHVVATSVADPTKSATAVITVVPIVVAVSPTQVLVEIGSTQTFAATVTGAVNPAVTWSVQEGTAGGSVTAAGVYTPPSTPGQFHVVATSVANTSKSASATVEVINPVTVTIVPASVSLTMQQTQQFSATVAGSANQAVTWSIKEGAAGGTITSAGLYTAPVVATTQTFHVVATPQANPAKATEAVVTVAPGVGVQVSPMSVTLSPNGTQQFTAVVTGTTNTAVTWAVQEGAQGGTVSSTGLYTAPATSGTWHIVVTSQADTTKRVVATAIVLGAPVTVTGTVTYTGAKTGRVYVILAERDGSAGIVGTSVALSGTTATFTLRGIQQRGGLRVRAFMDTLSSGMYHQAVDPFGSVGVTIDSTPLTGVNVTLEDSDWNGWFSTATPSITRVVASDGSALVAYEPAWDRNGNDECPRYTVYWSDTANVSQSNNIGSMTFTANAPRVAVVRGLTNGDRLYFTMRCPDVPILGGYAAEKGPIAIGSALAGFSLSGTVNQNAPSLTNAPLYVIALSDTAGYMAKVLSPVVGNQAWTITGMVAGTYRLVAFRDVGDDGKLTPLDPNSFSTPVTVTVNANQTAPAIELSAANAAPLVLTGHDNDAGSESYLLRLLLRPNLKRPVAVAVTTGPKLALPIDLPLDETGGARHTVQIPLGSIAPAAGDTYAFAVTYSDGTTETVNGTVSVLLPTFVMSSPATVASTTPVFTWQPLSVPSGTTYLTSLRLYDWSYLGLGTLAQVIGSADAVPMSTTTLSYADLHPTRASLSAIVLPYWYQLVAVDTLGNWTRRTDSFVAQ